jgi:hypothetical protein
MTRKTRTIALAMCSAALFVACSDDRPTGIAGRDDVSGMRYKAQGPKAKDGRAALLTNVPVSGALSDGGTFAGTFTAQRFDIDETTRQLSMTGVLTGNAISGGVTTAINQTFTTTVELSRESLTAMKEGDETMFRTVAQASCDVLFLDLGPLSLDLLGLTVDLSQVILDVNAVTGSGNLLGNLLCAVLGLLDGVALLPAITALLDSINNLLGGLGGILGAAA